MKWYNHMVFSPARPIKFGMQDIVHHTTSVANLETAWFNTPYSSWSNYVHSPLMGQEDQFSCHVFWNTFCNDGNGSNLWRVNRKICNVLQYITSLQTWFIVCSVTLFTLLIVKICEGHSWVWMISAVNAWSAGSSSDLRLTMCMHQHRLCAINRVQREIHECM